MRKSIWNHRIPTFAALGFIVGGIFVTSFLVSNEIITVGKASTGIVPQNVRVSNITDTSFTVAYSTQQETIGSISYGEPGSQDNTKSEDLLSENKGTFSHAIVIDNLIPGKTYEFSIFSNGSEFKNQNGTNYTGQTGPPITKDSSSKKLTGTILQEDGSAGNDSLVFLSSDGSSRLVTKTDNNGLYSFDLTTLRTQDLKKFLSIESTTLFHISVERGGASAKADFVSNDQTEIPPITLSNQYEFTATQNSFNGDENSATQSSSLQALQDNIDSISIQTPTQNAQFTDTRPQFKGTALPGETVKITVESTEPILAQVTATPNGTWTFRPPTGLSAGKHTITIETIDKNGIVQKIRQSFTVFAQGSQVDESATPSATTAPTITPTNTPIPTIEPTIFQSPTPTPTIGITPLVTYIIPSPTIISKEPAATGDTTSTIALTFGAVLSIITGSLILFTL